MEVYLQNLYLHIETLCIEHIHVEIVKSYHILVKSIVLNGIFRHILRLRPNVRVIRHLPDLPMNYTGNLAEPWTNYACLGHVRNTLYIRIAPDGIQHIPALSSIVPFGIHFMTGIGENGGT